MEADKKIKEVKMMPKTAKKTEGTSNPPAPAGGQKKLSYEELVDVTNQLQRQGQMLYQENMQLRDQRAIIRMNTLMEVLKLSEMFPKEMIYDVLVEIQEALYPEKEEVVASPEGANTVQ